MEKLNIKNTDRIVTIGVDVQKDFCTGGALAVPGGDEVVPVLNTLFKYTREHNGIVAHTQEQHPPVTPHFDIWPVHCVEDTIGAEFHDDLNVLSGDIIIKKGMGQTDGYSGFEGISDDGQTLEQIITPKRKERVAVLIGGLATEYCDKNTILEALEVAEKVRKNRAGKIAVYAIANAMRAVNINPDDGKKAMIEIQKAGAIIVNSEDIINGRVLDI